MAQQRSDLRRQTARLMFAAVQLLSRETPPLPLLDSMRLSPATRSLFIAAGSNAMETAFNRLFAGTLGSRASLWVAPQVEHTRASSRYSQEYERRVIDFF